MLNEIRIEAVVEPTCVNLTQYRDTLYEKFQKCVIHNPSLDRSLVSFQANKYTPVYSWFKYKEGFSQRLVVYLLEYLWQKPPGVLLDPFAGSGVALFAAKAFGWETNGIEVLPVGIYAIQARLVASRIDVTIFEKNICSLKNVDFVSCYDENYAFDHISITKGAFVQEEEKHLIGYISYCHNQVKNKDVRTLLLYAAFCILEEISYTRKDGQYLRWDYRSGRSHGKKPFNKGYIKKFREALAEKLSNMLADLKGGLKQGELFPENNSTIKIAPDPNLNQGSCLEILPTIPADSIDFVLTSPPYANRYDYTRTYALELVYLGCDDEEVKRLRQTMLSCTVENKDKKTQLQEQYSRLGRSADFDLINQTFEQQAALHEVLDILQDFRDKGQLNNKQIARMVHNYFYEMCFVVFELCRVMKPGGIIAIVNDNVQYAGEEVPVDLILSDIAETFGLTTRYIWTLGRGKGNSSQQMGNHGRSELRKCIYVWEKKQK
jgi:DNA modification methylase